MTNEGYTFIAGQPEQAAYYVNQLVRIAQEYEKGRYFHPVYREETVVTNPELNDLIFETLTANYLGWYYYSRGNHVDAQREFAKYYVAQSRIFDGNYFSDEEKTMAYSIFD